MPEPDYEKLGVFYLGSVLDPQGREGAPLLYESRDLCTHACILGMTGSGKTGLGVALIEEAAIDGIPAIVIDPKGDLADLALSFPGLTAAEFLPWIDADAARRAGRTPEAHAAAEADAWRQGLARSRQDGARIARLRQAAEVAVYTPGSEAGRPLAVLAALAAPPPAARADREVLQARCDAAVSSLLGLVGIDADPLASREHILLASLLLRAWGEGRDADLADLVAQVQDPPLERVGVLPLERFMPAKERAALALRLNNLLASPAFSAWIAGEPLDIDRLLHGPDGRARVAVVSIAHLGERERMFVVSLLLGQLLGWMRAQSGTASLRALLYMDEIAGYLPPVAAPPSKAPLMTLLKQARAFGLGVVLASQNPADLDYKALSNIGTWMVGRLQTDRDRAKVQAALEAVPGSAAAALADGLARLAPRAFLLHDVHAAAPVLFRSRWCLSYLRGPLTRELLERLRAGAPPAEPARGRPVAAGAPAAVPRPLLPPEVPQLFVPVRGAGAPVYAPVALALVRIGFADAKAGVRCDQDLVLAAPIPPAPAPVDWLAAEALDCAEADLERAPAAGAGFAALPAPVTAAAVEGWRRACADACFRTRTLTIWRCPALKLASRPGEDERAFRLRAAQAAREGRDAALARLRAAYQPKLAALEERLRRARASEEKERAQARSAQVDSFFAIGGAILGALMGRKAASAANIGRAASSARSLGRAAREQGDVGRAHDTVAAVQAQLDELEARFAEESAAAGAAADPAALALESAALLPKKTDIAVRLAALGWRA